MQLNDTASLILGLDNSMSPIPLHDALGGNDVRMIDGILPTMLAGSVWSGRLRVGSAPANRTPMPVFAVPHCAGGAEEPSLGTLVLAGDRNSVVVQHDLLTGLRGRQAVAVQLARAAERNRTDGNVLVVLFIDLDGLKAINDRYGHDAGDIALVDSARRIEASVPASATVGRFGGDEFVVVHDRAGSIDEGRAVAAKVLAALSDVDGYHARSASIGVATSVNGEINASELLRRADAAMYRAKRTGGSQVAVFDAVMLREQEAATELRLDVIDSVTDGTFTVAAEPQFELATGEITGVELYYAMHGLGPYVGNANHLFRLAHEFGKAFDKAMIDRAVSVAARWHAALGDRMPRVHVNISAPSLSWPQLASRFARSLEHTSLPGSLFVFEVESRDLAGTRDMEHHTTIAALRAQGAQLLVKDFGNEGLTVADLATWRPALIKLDADRYPLDVLRALVLGADALGVKTCIAGSLPPSTHADIHATGAFAGQGAGLGGVVPLADMEARLLGG